MTSLTSWPNFRKLCIASMVLVMTGCGSLGSPSEFRSLLSSEPTVTTTPTIDNREPENSPEDQSPTALPQTDNGLEAEVTEPTPVPDAVSVEPTATATATPIQTATPDPSLPKWTILVYMAADNNLDAAALFNLNQMEAARSSNDVNIIVQVDRAQSGEWNETRRYRIRPDDDPSTINSELLVNLGEQNMGDPDTLTEFISYGLDTFPAQNTALIMWNHGIGWAGIASDDTSDDDLSLNDLTGGISRALAGFPDQKFAMIGFDACLMGQQEIYSAMAPFAEVAVASQELTPVQGWPYTDWLNDIVDQADESSHGLAAGSAAGTALVDRFITYYADTYPSQFVTMAAVDLNQVTAVDRHFADLFAVLGDDLGRYVNDIAQIRAGTETYASAYGLNTDRYASIDMSHFARLISEEIESETVKEEADQLISAVDSAVISSMHGAGLREAHGIAFHFPKSDSLMDQRYPAETAQAGWPEFLDQYFSENRSNLIPPKVELLNTLPEETFGVSNLPYLLFRTRGLGIEEVALWGGQYLNTDGGIQERLVLEFDPLIPEPTLLANGQKRFVWQDGIHEDFFIWSTEVTYLTDGENGQFVVMWPSNPNLASDQSDIRVVEGIYTVSASNQAYQANLLFNQATGALEQIWGISGRSEPFEIQARPGDAFQPYLFILDGSDTLRREVGTILTLDQEGRLQYEWRPVPSGDYFLGFSASNKSGRSAITTQDFQVANEEAISESSGYLDPYLGYQFNYPKPWYRPTYADETLFTTSPLGDIALQVTVFPNGSEFTAERIKQEVLTQFGEVDILYEEEVVIGQRNGLSTAYGYTDNENRPHTGLFFTFSDDINGYLIDIDGLAETEDEIVTAADLVKNSFRFRTQGEGLFPRSWENIDIDQISVPQPDDFVLEPESNGWNRLKARSDNRLFLAFRRESIQEQTQLAVLDRLSDVASVGVDGYEQSPQFNLGLGNRVWLKRYFSYTNSNGEAIRGFLMVTRIKEQYVIAWGEGPAENFAEVDTNVYGAMLSEIE